MLLEYEEKFQKEVESGYQSAREELAVLDLLAEGAKTLDELIQGTGLDEERVRQILRFYVEIGGVKKVGDFWQICSLAEELAVTRKQEQDGTASYLAIPLLCA
ncbi:MAG: hypothetical protein VKL20_08840 [Synechocystis sp.]|nr:hypothetical protein [Synechocystis sp.]